NARPAGSSPCAPSSRTATGSPAAAAGTSAGQCSHIGCAATAANLRIGAPHHQSSRQPGLVTHVLAPRWRTATSLAYSAAPQRQAPASGNPARTPHSTSGSAAPARSETGTPGPWALTLGGWCLVGQVVATRFAAGFAAFAAVKSGLGGRSPRKLRGPCPRRGHRLPRPPGRHSGPGGLPAGPSPPPVTP